MSKRYREPVEVETAGGSIEAFTWRGARYAVRQVLCRWREAGGWWKTDGSTAQPWTAGDSHEVIRLHAARGRSIGTYELARDLRSGAWTLARVWD